VGKHIANACSGGNFTPARGGLDVMQGSTL
jgi:hypothetical protein